MTDENGRPQPFGETPEGLTREYLDRVEQTLIELQVKRDYGFRPSTGPRLLRVREAVEAFSQWCRLYGDVIPTLMDHGRSIVEAQCRDIEHEVVIMREALAYTEADADPGSTH